MTPKENIVSKAKASVSWIYSNILGKTMESQLRTATQNAQAREEYISWVSYLLPIEQALERAKKVEEVLELYKRLFDVCKEYKGMSIGLSDDSEFLNVMSELEEKTHE